MNIPAPTQFPNTIALAESTPTVLSSRITGLSVLPTSSPGTCSWKVRSFTHIRNYFWKGHTYMLNHYYVSETVSLLKKLHSQSFPKLRATARPLHPRASSLPRTICIVIHYTDSLYIEELFLVSQFTDTFLISQILCSHKTKIRLKSSGFYDNLKLDCFP